MATAQTDHNRVLRDVAREILAPMGLIQKGRSRIWLDDRRWHVIVVEFQPSGWSRGSYLNVGAMWLWYAKDHISFDRGHRVREFEDAGAGDWEVTARSLAQGAATRVKEIRDEIPDVRSAARLLLAESVQPGWPQYHAALATGLVGDETRSRHLFEGVVGREARYDWEQSRQARARGFLDDLSDATQFRSHVVDEVRQARAHLKLPTLPDDEIAAALSR